MTHGRLIALTVLTALALSACNKNNAPGTPAASSPPDTAAATPRESIQFEGSPQLATEPDGVAIRVPAATQVTVGSDVSTNCWPPISGVAALARV